MNTIDKDIDSYLKSSKMEYENNKLVATQEEIDNLNNGMKRYMELLDAIEVKLDRCIKLIEDATNGPMKSLENYKTNVSAKELDSAAAIELCKSRIKDNKNETWNNKI